MIPHGNAAGLRMKNLDVGALQAVFEVLQQHYPERLGELWFLNAPFIFWGLWRVVSPFIQQNTKDKIKFLSSKDRQGMLQRYIPPDVSSALSPMASFIVSHHISLTLHWLDTKRVYLTQTIPSLWVPTTKYTC